MTKKIIIIAVVLLLCVCAFTACNNNDNNEVVIRPAQTISIKTAAELADMRNFTGLEYSKYVFELENDIDLSGIDIWEPIGENITKSFMGKFDGKGHTISGLTLKGWENNGKPIFVGKDKLVVNETSYCSIGLFGYTKNTEISNITLSNVNIYYYTEGVASYTAALVGFDSGASSFSSITTSGSIRLSNVYSSVKTYDNKGIEQGTREICNTVQYMAGVVAYSSGSGTFSDINSAVQIENAVYKAIYKEADEVNGIEEGYSIRYDDAKTVLPEQVIAGGVLGLTKGAEITNITSGATLSVKGKSAYMGGVMAAAYGCDINNVTTENADLTSKVATKNTVGGTVALLDHSDLDTASIAGSEINEQCLGNEVQAATVGGAVGYAYDGSSIKNASIDTVTMKSMYEQSVMGGIAGIVRDSLLIDSEIEDGYYEAIGLGRYDGIAKYDKFYSTCGAIVGAIYGNSNVSDCSAKVQNHYLYYYNEGGSDVLFDGYISNEIAYWTKNSVTYVNEDGYSAIRFFKEGSLLEYIVAYATFSEGVLKVTFYSEENKILSEQSYNVGEKAGSESDSVKYKDTFFVQGQGIVAESGDAIAFENRDTTKYVYLSGIPDIDDSTLIVFTKK